MLCDSIYNICEGPIATNAGQVTQGTGCGWWNDACASPFTVSNIQMKNCTSYNVYYLKASGGCYAAYCMG